MTHWRGKRASPGAALFNLGKIGLFLSPISSLGQGLVLLVSYSRIPAVRLFSWSGFPTFSRSWLLRKQKLSHI
jgi:hypothetical protein